MSVVPDCWWGCGWCIQVREWCLGRYHDAATGIIYHPRFNPPPPVRTDHHHQQELATHPQAAAIMTDGWGSGWCALIEEQEVVSRLIWRTDDVPEVLERRLQLYRDKTRPLLGRQAGGRDEDGVSPRGHVGVMCCHHVLVVVMVLRPVR